MSILLTEKFFTRKRKMSNLNNSDNLDNLDQFSGSYSSDNSYAYDNEIIMNWYPTRIMLRNHSNMSLLELGLGHGIATKQFYFDRHLVLEGSQDVINNFNRKFPEKQVEITKTLFEDFQTDERFDIICMGFVLEHVNNPEQILRKYKHLLNEKGKMFIIVPNAESLNRRVGYAAHYLPFLTLLSKNDEETGHKRFYTKRTITKEILNAGLKIVNIEGIYLKPLATEQMKKLDLDKKLITGFCEVGIQYPELCCAMMVEVEI